MKSSHLPEIDTLSLKEQVAQMIVVRASGYLFDHEIKYPQWEPPAAKLQHLISDVGVGGVILLGGSAAELALRSQQLQSWAKIPLLVAADIEEGVGQRFSSATWFPPPMAIGAVAEKNLDRALQYAEQMGAIIAQEALAVGINWILAPVVDVNNNPDNPVINIRAFGETPEIVSQLGAAFIKGAKNYPALTTAKHFPGHGDTAVDSHLELPLIPHSEQRLAEVELAPFVSAIATGVDAVMSAHLLIPAWDEHLPATLSHKILTEQLRHKLGFEGLIVTDALIMGAITSRYGAEETAVLAVEAGVDILLMPVDAEAAIQAIYDAVTSGRIPAERIRASVERIWQAKRKVQGGRGAGEQGSRGAGEKKFLTQNLKLKTQNFPSTQYPVPSTFYQIAQPDAFETVENILRDSNQVFGSLPLPTENLINLRNLILVDDLLDCKYLSRQAPAVTIPQQLGYRTQLGDSRSNLPGTSGSEALQPTLLQIFLRGNPFRGSAGLTQVVEDWFKTLLTNGELQALVIYGSPYIKNQFLPFLPAEIPCVCSFGQIPAAQEIALRLLFANYLPVRQ
ncbi:beta-glucosidase [[Phormidium ambiguum] IAM M-71]|uniref:beta-N-acetylhexosaminidase n=1 Tax=[Phormidium ambiguum] IAM M-71 TaxID=454136 RepID=A0A1U7ITT7_9CYAN|nr:glycoside hydrolase family 3 N-terminal domain-containing protein [Phormidium ambiguum]OKH40895.1 beta-glucosidase [Phormidium ambiguum IAM M-71]